MPDLTKLPHRHAWHLAWPLMLSNLTTPLMGLADTAMLGHLDSSLYLAAAAIGANVLTFSLWMFGFLRMGTTSLTGQALGAQQTREIRLLLYRGLLMGATLGAALIVLQIFLLPHILGLMTPDDQVRQLAQTYCAIRFAAAPAVLMTYAALGWFIGLQQSRVPLLITLLVNVLNLLLDWLLIMVMGWGSDGAALASACAEYAGLGVVALLVWRQLRTLEDRRSPRGQSWLLTGWRALWRINADLFVRTALLLAVFSFFTARGAHLGAEVVAANAILLQLLLLISHFLDGYAHAAETLVARSVGAKNLAQFKRLCVTVASASVMLAILATAALAAGQQLLAPALTSLPPVRAELQRYYPWLLMLPLISVWCYLLDGIFIGAGHTRSLRNWMFAAVALVFAPAWWLSQPWHNHGLWLSFTLFNLARGIFLGGAFVNQLWSGRWMHAKSITPRKSRWF